jgi:hypothetical protein
MYRMAYSGCEGFHVLTHGAIGHSPPLTWETLEEAQQAANWDHATVYSGYYVILDENDKRVYSTQGRSRKWEDCFENAGTTP